jgi:hypothetical protein
MLSLLTGAKGSFDSEAGNAGTKGGDEGRRRTAETNGEAADGQITP